MHFSNVRRMSGGVLPRKQGTTEGRVRRKGNYDGKVYIAQEGGVYSIGQYWPCVCNLANTADTGVALLANWYTMG